MNLSLNILHSFIKHPSQHNIKLAADLLINKYNLPTQLTSALSEQYKLLDSSNVDVHKLALTSKQLEKALNTQHQAFNAFWKNSKSNAETIKQTLHGRDLEIEMSEFQRSLRESFRSEIVFKLLFSHYLRGLEEYIRSTNQYSEDYEIAYHRRVGTLVEISCLKGIFEDTISHAESQSISQFGSHPRIELECAEGLGKGMLVVEQHVHFVLLELLKNSIGALVSRYGSLDLDECPRVLVRVSGSDDGRYVGFQVEDRGCGTLGECVYDYFVSSVVSLGEPTYTYSRAFGPPYSGFGVGLSHCLGYVRVCYGGSMQLSSLCGYGTSSSVWLSSSRSTRHAPLIASWKSR
jgi:hypothetical protein